MVHCIDGLELIGERTLGNECEGAVGGFSIFEARAMERCGWIVIRVEVGVSFGLGFGGFRRRDGGGGGLFGCCGTLGTC